MENIAFDNKRRIDWSCTTAKKRWLWFYHMERSMRRHYGKSQYPRFAGYIPIAAWRIALQRKLVG